MGQIKSKSVTLNDVARHARVSPMTVSRVMNEEGAVRDVTREKVLASVQALNYKPNLSARALAGNKSYKVAFLYENPSAFYLSELLVGALEEISRHGHQLFVHKVPYTESEQSIIENLQKLVGEYVGVIVPAPLGDVQAVRDFLFDQDIPVVYMSGAGGDGRNSNICIDDYEAALEITEHLIGLGHNRIALIRGDPAHFASEERYRGYKDALIRNGIALSSSYISPGFFTFESGADAARKLLSMKDRPTAIFASNDDMAAGTLMVAASKHIKVPDNLSVVGFDDSPLAASVYPRLTTVKQPISKMAKVAISSLIDLVKKCPLREREFSSRIIMDYKIIEGKSVGRAPEQEP